MELEVNLILEQNAQKPIEGVAEFLLERASILKQKVELKDNRVKQLEKQLDIMNDISIKP